MWDRADARLAPAYWPWSLLAQPEPLPERILAAAPDAVVDNALGGCGSDPATFPPEVRAAYADALRDPTHVHAICEEYCAAASVDRAHDAADRAAGCRIACPVLALWGAGGALDTRYADAGRPIATWRDWSDDVRGGSGAGGHFLPSKRSTRPLRRSGASSATMTPAAPSRPRRHRIE